MFRLIATDQLNKNSIGKIPIAYLEFYHLFLTLQKLNQDVDRTKEAAIECQKTWSNLKISRNNYKLAHRRIVNEKHQTLQTISTLLDKTKQKLPTLDEYHQKIETVDKDRMLLELEVQRLRQLRDRLLSNVPKEVPEEKTKPVKEEKEKVFISHILSANPVLNPYLEATKPSLENFTHRVVHQGHPGPISSISLHPKRKVYATCGDDAVWHVWNAENNSLLISGRGHSKWISSSAFHPRGSFFATSSADGTSKVWDFLSSKCSIEFKGHLDVVWGCDFHFAGRVFGSCGSDSTLRFYDLESGQSLEILRGHDRDILSMKFVPFSNLVVTGGTDHLVGIWDSRAGAMIGRGIGHTSCVFSACPSLNNKFIASVDGQGGVKLWDLRKMSPVFQVQVEGSLNCCSIDASGSYIFTAGSDGKGQVFLTDNSGSTWTMANFDKPCEAVSANLEADLVVFGGMDGNIAVCTAG